MPNAYGKDVPVKNGIIPSLGWVSPLSQHNNEYYEPEGGLTQAMQNNFRKLLKTQFGLDLEADFRGAYSRIFVVHSRMKERMGEYLQKMEKYEIMPESKETYRLRQEEARAMEDALFYEMAKGGLAVIPAGEAEPRQIRCDVSQDAFVVTEPFSQCAPQPIMEKYKVHEPVYQPVPQAPEEINEPDPFTEPEPLWPEKPEPVAVNPPGREPVPPRFMNRPVEPDPPLDPMRFGSKEALAEEIFREKLEESGLKEPTEQLEDPGEFTMNEPEEVAKPDIVIPEAPIKPEAFDIAEQMAEALEEEAPELDRRVLWIEDQPGPFEEKEPVRPVMVKPADVPSPVYYKMPDRPKLKYRYEFDEPEPPELRHPEIQLPDPPVLDLSDLKEPPYPELGPEPPKPGVLARMFSWVSARAKEKVTAYDKWKKDAADLPRRREQWEAEQNEYQNKIELRERKYAAEKAEYDRLSEEYRKDAELYQEENNVNLLRYEKKSQAYQEALEKFGGGAYVTAKAMLRDSRMRGYDLSSDPKLVADHQKLKEEYEKQLEIAKKKLADEKLRVDQEYQEKLDKWEKENSGTIEENLRRKNEFEKKLDEFHDELDKWEENFLECHGDPEKISRKYDELETDYQNKLKQYFDDKEEHEKRVKRYEDSKKRCKENAVRQGMDPEEALAANIQFRADTVVHEKKIDDYHKYLKDHPEIKTYNNELVDYNEAIENKEWAENSYDEYIEEKREYDAAKKEYDQKKAAFDDLEAAKKHYREAVDTMKKEAGKEAEQQIENYDNAQNEYKSAYKKYREDDNNWLFQKSAFDENVRRMYEPGGVHTRWKERKKDYEDANQQYRKQLEKYEKDKYTFKSRHDAWEMKKQDHESQVKKYNLKKAVYDSKMEQIQKVKDANALESEKAKQADLQDPLFKDYLMNTGRYASRDTWHKQFDGDYKNVIENRKKMDLSREAEKVRTMSETYQKRKKAAPTEISKAEEYSYNLRKKEKAHLDKYPSGMKNFVRDLYHAENRAVSNAGKMKNLNKEAYRDAALQRMYLSVVRKKTDKFAHSADGLLGNTKDMEALLKKDNMDYAISQMKNGGIILTITI